MKLTKLQVKDFKRVSNVELPLAGVNILVGANGSGKSSILQAAHLAVCMIRQAERISDKTSTVGVDELDYLPTDDYKMLAHNSVWGNKWDSACSEIKFKFRSEHGVNLQAECKLRSARNAGISISGFVHYLLYSRLRRDKSFFSAYIPGISEIPNKEEKRGKKVIWKQCSFGDSNLSLRNVLHLIKAEPMAFRKLQQRVSQIIGPFVLGVTFDETKHTTIHSWARIGDTSRPLELVGSGYLQLIQIFAYIQLFKPGLLLIDEPDIHLNPSVQEKLVSVLEEVAREEDLSIIIATHSPFIVRGASPAANVYWLENGVNKEASRQTIELALGWGAIGKRVIIFSEDSKIDFLKKLVNQWPDIARSVTFFPGIGVRDLISPTQGEQIVNSLGGSFKILIHRDRDSLTDSEMATLEGNYAEHGVSLWLTEDSAIEAYFCFPEFLAAYLDMNVVEAKQLVDEAIQRRGNDSEAKFRSHREAHNREIHTEGGSPHNNEVWSELQQLPLQGASAKLIFRCLHDIVPENRFREKKILSDPLPVGIPCSLRIKLRELLVQE